ncbi:MAG: DNA repair protein RadC [Gammaproteobacteria bacterium]|jgi:DNA repair protein RadC
MTIKDWPLAERPREKLLDRGLDSLSDAELLAIVFGKGFAGCDAVQLARNALSETGGISALVGLDRQRFTAFAGLGDAKFVALHAGIEVGRRALRETLQRSSPITDVSAAKMFLSAELGNRTREAFCALFLDNRHRVIRFEILALGTLDSATVHPREVVKRVLELNAAAVILAHNHPSGVGEPSLADTNLTRILSAALKLIDVRILDHLIIAGQEVVSFADRGLLE